MNFHRPFKGCGASKRSEKGTTSIEMALIAPVFFLFLMGVVEVSLIFLTQHLLENATFNASRLAKTGFVTTGSTQLETVKARLFSEIDSLSGLIDTTKVTWTTSYYGSLSAMSSSGTSGLGTASDIMVFQVSYPWTFFTPLIGDLMGTNGVMTLTARMVVKNEPY